MDKYALASREENSIGLRPEPWGTPCFTFVFYHFHKLTVFFGDPKTRKNCNQMKSQVNRCCFFVGQLLQLSLRSQIQKQDMRLAHHFPFQATC